MKRKNKQKIAPILAGLAGLLMIAGLLGYLFFGTGDIPTGPDMCPIDKKYIPASNVLLIDVTEGLAPAQIDLVRTELMRLFVTDAHKYEKFTTYLIKAKQDDSKDPISVVCNPKSQKGNFDEGTITRKKWQELFVNKLNNVLTANLQHAGSLNSPIMEMIQTATATGLKKDYEVGKKRLIIVSDMMQYSNLASQYGGLRSLSDSTWKAVETDLHGVDVTVFYVERSHGPSVQPKGHRDFWNDYFRKMGAQSVAFVDIFGDSLTR